MKRFIFAAIALLIICVAAQAAIFKNWAFSHVEIVPPLGVPVMHIYNAQGQWETIVISMPQWLYAATQPAGQIVSVHDINGDGDTLDVDDDGDKIVWGISK